MDTQVTREANNRPDEALIAEKIKSEVRLQSIVEETFLDFVIGQSPRSAFGIVLRILILCGVVAWVVSSARSGMVWINPVFLLVVYGALEAVRANRRIDALVRLQRYRAARSGAGED